MKFIQALDALYFRDKIFSNLNKINPVRILTLAKISLPCCLSGIIHISPMTATIDMAKTSSSQLKLHFKTTENDFQSISRCNTIDIQQKATLIDVLHISKWNTYLHQNKPFAQQNSFTSGNNAQLMSINQC